MSGLFPSSPVQDQITQVNGITYQFDTVKGWLRSTSTFMGINPTNYIYVAKNGNNEYNTGGIGDPFLTIQKAIDIASSGTTIFIYPSTYTENLTLKAGVNITSSTRYSTYITGNHTANFTGTVIIQNIVLNSSSGATLTFSGTGVQNLQFLSSDINSTSGDAINWSNTNSASRIQIIDGSSTVSNSSSTARCFYSTTGASGGLIANRTSFKLNNPDNIALAIGGAVSFTHTSDQVIGQIVVSNTATTAFALIAMTTATVPVFVTNSSNISTLSEVVAITTSTPAFSGAGIFLFFAIGYGSTGTGGSATLNGGAGAIAFEMAPIRFRSSALYGIPQDGIFEYNGSNPYFTVGTARTPIVLNNLGVTGGTTLIGDTASGGNLNLSSTSNATKGKIIVDSDIIGGTTTNTKNIGSATIAMNTVNTRNVASDDALSLNSGGTDKNITLTPSGTGKVNIIGNVDINGKTLFLNTPNLTDIGDANGISFYESNEDYKIGYDSVGGTKGYLRYNVDLVDVGHGHIFSAGDLATGETDLMLVRADGVIGVGTVDLDGTPAIGKLTVKGNTNDGSTNILVGRDSDEVNVFSVDTNGKVTTKEVYANTISTADGVNGYVTMNVGGTRSGFFEWRKGDNTRLGFMGDGEFDVNLALENNANFAVNSSTGGFVAPRMTKAQRLALTGVEGLEVYQTDGNDKGKYIYNGTKWEKISNLAYVKASNTVSVNPTANIVLNFSSGVISNGIKSAVGNGQYELYAGVYEIEAVQVISENEAGIGFQVYNYTTSSYIGDIGNASDVIGSAGVASPCFALLVCTVDTTIGIRCVNDSSTNTAIEGNWLRIRQLA